MNSQQARNRMLTDTINGRCACLFSSSHIFVRSVRSCYCEFVAIVLDRVVTISYSTAALVQSYCLSLL